MTDATPVDPYKARFYLMCSVTTAEPYSSEERDCDPRADIISRW